ncbi:probable galacturonosyltransferase 7 isoform X2 [Amaranthus tricolor]|uniref:probable galacturonosyltransferase 7 isoform X2 n=1 Tax=Amaranthus tricolor TaxID=29722 RepID=UPI00258F5A61|nr:probable galacturonosyltransferase 7 isoform X2 [Amaranthus tricolor]
MKSGVVSVNGVGISTTKRRWRGFVIAVLGLVFLSMLVPLVFLIGFHHAFHSSPSSSGSGFPSQQQTSLDDRAVGAYESHHYSNYNTMDPERVGKQDLGTSFHIGINGSITKGHPENHVDKNVQKASPERYNVNINSPMALNQGDESEVLCELRFGSYCLWRREYKVAIIDSMVKKLKDRLFVARAYFPSIAKLPAHEKLSKELKQNIQDFERMLTEATTDAELPPHVENKLLKMEAAIAKAKSIPVNCNNVDKKFRQLVDLTEDEANFHTKQSAFLYKLAVHTMPKSLHCLSMRLTVAHFQNPSVGLDDSVTEKFVDPDMYHYVMFSNNVLASSVAINSTVLHAKESKKLVFHVLTDRQNFFAMKLWFIRNTFKKASIQVLNFEDYNTIPGLSLSEEFRVTYQVAKLPKMHYKTNYISLFSHSHYFLPEIFKTLDKIVVLDDDVIVQQDLSALWRLNMGKMVNGAAEFCAVRLGQLDNYLGNINFNRTSCAWMSGLNVINLTSWRKLNLSEKFQTMVQEFRREGRLLEAAASRASLLTFQDLVYALDETWVRSGLGHEYGLDVQSFKNSAVLHYSGNMKPWLELGIPKYKSLWLKFINREDQFLSDCNVIP